MKSLDLKSTLIATIMVLPLGFVFAAEPEPSNESQRQTALARIAVAKEAALATSNNEERAESYSEYGGNLEAYLLNGLAASDDEEKAFQREAYDAFVLAAEYSTKDYSYSRKIADLAVALNEIDLLRDFFEPYLEKEGISQNIYVARIDYAHGLEQFGRTEEAEEHLLDAISIRAVGDAYEATYRYILLLKSTGRLQEALSSLRAFSNEAEEMHTPDLLYLEREILIELGENTEKLDEQIEQFLESMSGMGGVSISQRVLAERSPIEKLLNIQRAQAFSHLIDVDDSRGTLANSWWVINANLSYARWAMNGAEVLYNEARGEPGTARNAVAWAIRNRAFIDMNGADHYPGAESDSNVSNCRIPTPIGPQPTTYPLSAKHYSCVVHGDTWIVGSSHSQMDDSHVDISALMTSGLMSTFLGAVNNYISDPTYPYSPLFRDSGNPNGAQEWRNRNYCAANSVNKRRHGNVGGDYLDPGNICPTLEDPSTIGDNYFWGRKP